MRSVLHEEFGHIRPRLHLALGLSRLLPPFVGNRVRTAVLRLGGLQIGRGTVVFGRITVTGSRHPANTVRIGRWCWVNRGCIIDASAPVTIADHVAIGHDVLLMTSTHEVGPAGRRASAMMIAPVTIRQGAWIGARTVVLPGVTIGDGAVVGAGAVVNRDVAANTLVGGVPARELRHLEGEDPPGEHPGNEQPGNEQPGNEHPDNEQPGNEQPGGGPITLSPILTSLRAEPRT
ncbi:MAG TPA: acyltransferase [Ilumatobacteraceae bacterium]|nr:acyltransferase [Ilumatobacteraceae bacterium]